MALIVILALIALPLLEIAVFIAVGERIGATIVIGTTILTAIIGLGIARAQGVGTLVRARAAMSEGRPPVAELIEGAFIALAGLFLLIPGFLSDLAGALLLIAPLRRLLAARIVAGAGRPADYVEGDYRIIDPDQDRLPPRRDELP